MTKHFFSCLCTKAETDGIEDNVIFLSGSGLRWLGVQTECVCVCVCVYVHEYVLKLFVFICVFACVFVCLHLLFCVCAVECVCI